MASNKPSCVRSKISNLTTSPPIARNADGNGLLCPQQHPKRSFCDQHPCLSAPAEPTLLGQPLIAKPPNVEWIAKRMNHLHANRPPSASPLNVKLLYEPVMAPRDSYGNKQPSFNHSKSKRTSGMSQRFGPWTCYCYQTACGFLLWSVLTIPIETLSRRSR